MNKNFKYMSGVVTSDPSEGSSGSLSSETLYLRENWGSVSYGYSNRRVSLGALVPLPSAQGSSSCPLSSITSPTLTHKKPSITSPTHKKPLKLITSPTAKKSSVKTISNTPLSYTETSFTNVDKSFEEFTEIPDIVTNTAHTADSAHLSHTEHSTDSPAPVAQRGIKLFTEQGVVDTNVDSFTEEQLATFRQIFDMYDKNGDNVINVEELRGILEILGYSPSPDEVEKILERFDQDNSGTIDFDEYLVLIQHWIEQDEEQIYEAFKVFDKDGDGFVSAQELKRALTQYGEQFTEDEANEFFNMMDTDGDGVINYEEFVEYLRSMQKYSTE